MGIETLYAFLGSAILLCADPISSGGKGLGSPLRSELERGRFEVVASSPLPAGHGVGSHFGWRTSTRTGQRTFHAGADFLVARGTPVYAVRGGIVEHVAHDVRGRSRFAGYGNAIVIRHPDLGRWSFYAHLDSIEVEEGQVVHPGERIGAVGNTHNGRFPSMVPHLHFEVRRSRPDGSSPFPGPYRRFNENPEYWLAALGVRLAPDDDPPAEAWNREPNAPMLVVRGREPLAEEAVTVAEVAVGTAQF